MNAIKQPRKSRVSVPGHDRIPISTQENIAIESKLLEYSAKTPPTGMSYGVVVKVSYKNDKVMGWVRKKGKNRNTDVFFSQFWSGSRWVMALAKLDVVCLHMEAGHVEAQVYPLSFFKPGEGPEEEGVRYGIITGSQVSGDGKCYGQVLAMHGFKIDEYQFKFLPLGVSADDIQLGTTVCFSPHQLPNGQLQARKIRPLGVDDSQLQVQAVRSRCGVMAKRQVVWRGMVLSIYPEGGEFLGEIGIILFETPVTCAIGSFRAGADAGSIKAGDIVDFEHELGRAGRYYALNVRPAADAGIGPGVARITP